MTMPAIFQGRLSLPAIGAPMFLVSGPELVAAQCAAGVLGTFPSLNARPESELQVWIDRIRTELASHDAAHPDRPSAPFGVNLISNRTNARFDHDAQVCIDSKVPLLLTSLSPPGDLVQAAHAHGGVVFHDVTTVRHAEKAIAQGVDGLILVANGAGGHAGTANPFALLAEVRQIFAGTIVLAGAIGTGRAVHGALALGADMVCIGSRFITAAESRAPDDYRQMVIEARLKDIIYTPAFSGLPANYLRQSIEAAGLDPDALRAVAREPDRYKAGARSEARAWRDIRGAGQGIGLIDQVQPAAEIITGLIDEWHAAEAASDTARAQRRRWLR